jgi:hypothetical protein
MTVSFWKGPRTPALWTICPLSPEMTPSIPLVIQAPSPGMLTLTQGPGLRGTGHVEQLPHPGYLLAQGRQAASTLSL